jgi:hypothetical protein
VVDSSDVNLVAIVTTTDFSFDFMFAHDLI